MNPEIDPTYETPRSNPSFLKRVGETTLGIGVAYVGLKIGEGIFDFKLSYLTELAVSTAIGATPINIRYAMLEGNSHAPEQ